MTQPSGHGSARPFLAILIMSSLSYSSATPRYKAYSIAISSVTSKSLLRTSSNKLAS